MSRTSAPRRRGTVTGTIAGRVTDAMADVMPGVPLTLVPLHTVNLKEIACASPADV